VIDGTGTGTCFFPFFVLTELFKVKLLFLDDEDLLFDIGGAEGDDDEDDECEGAR